MEIIVATPKKAEDGIDSTIIKPPVTRSEPIKTTLEDTGIIKSARKCKNTSEDSF